MRKTAIVCAAMAAFVLSGAPAQAGFLFFGNSGSSCCNSAPAPKCCNSGGLFSGLKLSKLRLPKLPSLGGNKCCNPAPVCFTPVPATCSDGHNPTVVAPQLSLKGTEEYEVRGKSFTRYRLTIENHAAFANEMFRAAPNLPPCGKNKNSARTWVDIMSSDGKRLYGFCAFSSAESLTQLWFAVSAGSTAPKGVYVVLNDREKGVKHKSNTIVIKAPEMGAAGEKTTSVDDGGVESIYKVLKISNVQIVGGPFSVGDTVMVAYKLTNTSDDALRVPVDKSYPRPFNLVGTRQHWVERQGDESTIPGISPRIARQGSRYAAGGSIIQTKTTIAAGESLSFQQRVSTKDYPAGKYTYYIEYKKVRGGILQTEKIDFELTDK